MLVELKQRRSRLESRVTLEYTDREIEQEK